VKGRDGQQKRRRHANLCATDHTSYAVGQSYADQTPDDGKEAEAKYCIPKKRPQTHREKVQGHVIADREQDLKQRTQRLARAHHSIRLVPPQALVIQVIDTQAECQGQDPTHE